MKSWTKTTKISKKRKSYSNKRLSKLSPKRTTSRPPDWTNSSKPTTPLTVSTRTRTFSTQCGARAKPVYSTKDLSIPILGSIASRMCWTCLMYIIKWPRRTRRWPLIWIWRSGSVVSMSSTGTWARRKGRNSERNSEWGNCVQNWTRRRICKNVSSRHRDPMNKRALNSIKTLITFIFLYLLTKGFDLQKLQQSSTRQLQKKARCQKESV